MQYVCGGVFERSQPLLAAATTASGLVVLCYMAHLYHESAFTRHQVSHSHCGQFCCGRPPARPRTEDLTVWSIVCLHVFGGVCLMSTAHELISECLAPGNMTDSNILLAQLASLTNTAQCNTTAFKRHVV